MHRSSSYDALALLAQDGAPSAQPKGEAEDRSQAFRPVQGGGNVAPGEVLLVEAYAAFWIVAMVLILGTWRRQRRLDARVSQLKSDLERARRPPGGD